MTTKKKSSKKVTPRMGMRSFRLSPPDKPFLTFAITHQTFYWVTICLFVLALGVWAVLLSVKIQEVYDKVDSLVHQESQYTPKD